MILGISKIALGGGCHWCTEAIYQSLKGVEKVEQGYVASTGENDTFSEAVIVNFNADVISLATLIEIHLYTHKSTSDHSMREKYRSAVYVFSEEQKESSENIIQGFQKEFDDKLITSVYTFKRFKASREEILDYYYENPDKPFCKKFIDPKLKLLQLKFLKEINK